jgi:hypothetical protein
MAVADAVGKDDKVFCCVEELAGAEEVAGEQAGKEVGPAAGGAMHDQDGVGDLSFNVFYGLAEGDIMDVEFRKGDFAAPEGKILNFEVSFGLVGVVGGGLLSAGKSGCSEEKNEEIFHAAFFSQGESTKSVPMASTTQKVSDCPG